MTVVQYVKRKLERDWAEDIRGRVVNVPKPTFRFEKEDEQERLQYNDVAVIIDGGIQEIEPADVHYDSETIITLVNVRLKTADRNRPRISQAIGSPGRVRMFGYRDEETLESERLGGLTGETRRIFQTVRRGSKEFDLITTPEVNDVSNQTGKNHYQAVVTGRFRQIADEINSEI